MTRKYIVFSVNFSGVSEKIFLELREKGIELEIFEIPKIWRIYIFAIISSFSLNYRKWILKAERKYNKLQKSTWAFKLKSKWCSKKIRHINVNDYAGLIQISGTFNCKKYSNCNLSLYILTDYTMKLAENKRHQIISPLLPPTEKESYQWHKLETELYLSAKRVTIPSKYIGHSLMEHYGVHPSSISVIGYGANLQPKTSIVKNHVSKNGPHLLFVGKMFEQKGGSVIVEAFSVVREKWPSATLTIVGPRVDPRINVDGVTYLGRIYDKEKLSTLYSKSDLFLIHSAYEAFGLVLLEAMAHGVPCIGSDIDAMPDILVDTNSGSVIPFGSPSLLANEIIRYLDSQELYSMSSKSGIEAINSYYNWSAVGNRFYKVITESD